ncbi:gp53-like domain-containing protein [Acetobacter senegalensis]|uniref:gp53-like domain-containing protein n=1 Tax=Acetobacter senegalensis TaxID=446692 RepID=UPI000777FF1D|nr:hypothetical protein [Acetobacter senegalensis]
MKSTDNLGLFGTLIGADAASGNISTVPDTQATAGDGTASIALGFPPETFIDRAAGGEPPRGQDMNGFLNRISRAIQVLQAGYFGPFNAAFAAAIGGYPSGAIVRGSVVGTFWVSTADNNTTTPGASGATWQNLFSGYLPLAGGTLTGDTTIKGLASWSTTGNYTSNGLILSGQNSNIVTLRQNETTGKYTQLAIQVNGYNSSNGYFSLRNDGTFWSGTTQFADRTWVTNNFSDTFSSSGNDWFWMKFPSGVLIQGGNATYSASDGTTGTKVTLPTSFGAQFIIAVGNDIGSNANAVTVMRTDASTIHLLGREVTSGSLSDTVINYFCVGTAPS